MQIENVELFNLRYEVPPGAGFHYGGGQLTARVTSIVKVTATGGLVGWGAAYSHPDLVRIVVEAHLKPFLLGRDPTEVEALWGRMYRLTRWYGRKGAAMSALGALDTAFWDLRGKAAGKPVHVLLGGERRRVPVYASALLWKDDVGALAAEAASYIDQGFRRVKMRLGRNEDYDLAAVRAVRQAVGPANGVIVDASMRYDLETAIRIGKVIEELGAYWFEEPFEPEDIDSYAALRKALKVPIAAGENDFGLQGFREMLRAGALDIVQPDACRAGGISEVLAVGRMAQQFGAQVGTHTWSDAVALVANMHVVGALPNGISVEMDRTGNPFIDELLVEPLRVADGHLTLSDRPGLGIDVDEAVLRRLAMDGPIPDGAYSDMSFGRAYDFTPPPYHAGAAR
jgi:L-alanine-DL-glutamate epimerase-like enolase superfamily enzyme